MSRRCVPGVVGGAPLPALLLFLLLGLAACQGGPGRVPGAGPLGPGTPSVSIAQAPRAAAAPATAAAAAPTPAPTPAPAPAPALAPADTAAGVAGPAPAATSATPAGGEPFTFRFAVGDRLEVSVWKERDLTTAHTVLRDGTIPAKAIGNVRVVGRTLDDVHAELTKRYGEFLVDPRVSIRVLSIWSDRVFVVGEVAKPTAIAMPGDMTLMQAITEAGGFNPGVADMRTVRVIRRTSAGRPRVLTFNAEALLAGRGRAMRLAPGDLVYVHPTGLADWARKLDQVLTPIGTIVGNVANVTTAVAVTK